MTAAGSARRGEDHRPHTTRRADPSGVERKRVALTAGVVADDHASSCSIRFGFQQVVDDACGCLLHHQTVHSLRPGADRGTESRCTELQPAVEACGQFVVASG